MGVNQTNWIRPKNVSGGRRLLLAFTPSNGLLDPCRSRVHERLPCITYVLLVTISIAMTQGLGHAQTPVASQEPALPSSTTANDRSRNNQLTSIREPLGQMATSPCRLQVQTTFAQPSAKATEATSTIAHRDLARKVRMRRGCGLGDGAQLALEAGCDWRGCWRPICALCRSGTHRDARETRSWN
jgi:hypothetical protein